MAGNVTRIFDHNDYIDAEEKRASIEEICKKSFDDLTESEKDAYLGMIEGMDYETECENIQSVIGDSRIVAKGTGETWSNSQQCGFVSENLQGATKELAGGDCGHIGFYMKDGEFHMTFSHHDGKHDVILRSITDAGEKHIESQDSCYDSMDYDVLNDVFSSSEYSKSIVA